MEGISTVIRRLHFRILVRLLRISTLPRQLNKDDVRGTMSGLIRRYSLVSVSITSGLLRQTKDLEGNVLIVIRSGSLQR